MSAPILNIVVACVRVNNHNHLDSRGFLRPLLPGDAQLPYLRVVQKHPSNREAVLHGFDPVVAVHAPFRFRRQDDVA